MSHIVHLLTGRIVDQLTVDLQTSITDLSDYSRADIVKRGRFQESPIQKNVYIWVSGGNPMDPYEIDGRIGIRDMDNLGIRIPSGEVGGGHLWWRRGRVEIGCFFIQQRLDQDTASDAAHIVLGRVTNCLERLVVSDLTDDWNERAYYLMVYASNFFEGGGPTNQYLWRGEVLWQALTQRP